jgi:hypothetical protein
VASLITNTTIYNCFQKSTLVLLPISLLTPIIPSGIADLYRMITEAGNIYNTIAISNFLNPVDEMEAGEENEHIMGDEEIFEEVIQEYLSL